MARIRTTRYKPAVPSLSEHKLRKINAAFDEAAVPLSERQSVDLPSPKKKRKMAVLDDEEENDDDFEMVIGAEPGSSQAAGERGKSVLEGDNSLFGADDGGGGGFFREPEGFLLDDTRGGFLLDADSSGGGFLAPDSDGGGFLLDSNAFDSGGGFLLEDTSMGPGGGFLPDDLNDYSFDPSLDFSSLPPLPDLPPLPSPSSAMTNTATFTRNRIPLHAIPSALEALDLPSDSHDLLATFRDAASDDEDGVASVSRERFLQVCEVLLDGDKSSEEEGSDEQETEESEGYIDESRKSRKATLAPRRSTRNNPSLVDAKGKGRAVDMDVVDFASESSDSAASSDDGAVSTTTKSKTRTLKGRTKGGIVKRKDRNRVLSKEEMQEAQDTFDLFFEGSQSASGKRVIGMEELRRVADLLGEKIDDSELLEMLEYGGRTGGVVDFAAFSKVMAEAL